MYCLISRKLMNNTNKPGSMYRQPGVMYRETPEASRDSGWRFYLGDETEEYLAGAGNLTLVDLDEFLSDNTWISPKYLVKDIPCGHMIDLRNGKAVKYCGENLTPVIFGLLIARPEQISSLPKAKNYGNPGEYAVFWKDLSLNERMQLRRVDGTLFIESIVEVI